MRKPATAGPAAAGSGRTVLVTGGSRGIGAVIVRKLAPRGVRAGCGYASSEAVAKRLAEEFPGLVLPVHYELGDAESAGSAVHRTAEFGDGLDGVVANAGVWAGGKLTNMSDEVWGGVVQRNLMGAAPPRRTAIRLLTESTAGNITVISLVIGLIGGPGDTAYASAKVGRIGFAKSLAKEAASDGVRSTRWSPASSRRI